MTSTGSTPQAGAPQEGGSCEHEWVLHRDYDSDNNLERPYIECRLCGQNAGDSVGEIYVHADYWNWVQHPEFNSEYTYRKPIRFGGSGFNRWYPAET